MVTICLQCGDKGFSNALVFCVRCHEVAAHWYCLDNVTFDELVNWVCDDCEENELPITNSDADTPGTDLAEDSHAVQPVHDPIWRGGFNIWNKEYKTLGGLVAHLSIKTCQRDSEEMKSFTPYLRFEMVSKSDLWHKCFNTSKASDDDIAVYFFPSEAKYEQDFDHLIEDMIGGEHALRAFMPNADLMVFTSTELPLSHWRFQQKHYLWGVFRAKQGSSSHQSGTKSVICQTPENVLAARDEINKL